MKKFRTALFNGYQKAAVDEYLEDLTQELEDLREDALKVQAVDQLRSRFEKLKEENESLQQQLQERSELLNTEKAQKEQFLSEHERQLEYVSKQFADVTKQLTDEKRRNADREQQLKAKELLLQELQQREEEFHKERQRLVEMSSQYTETEEKLKRYENGYSDFMDLMVNMKTQARQIVTDAQADAEEILLMARKDADNITASAQENAEKITDLAKVKALDHRQNVEKELKKKQEEEALKFQIARFKIAGYLESLNHSQNKLIEVYEEFGRLVGQLPLRLGDVFSEEDFELLEDNEEKKTDSSFSASSDRKKDNDIPYSKD